MNSMIERVAHALAVALSGSSTPLAGESDWQTLRHLARAAIEAMREPTGAMNDAAAVELPQLVRPGANYQVEIDDDAGTQIWYVMIREALKEPR